MHTSTHTYHHDTQALQGYLAYDDTSNKPRPAVLVLHDWSGCNDFAKQQALELAEQGYLGFAADIYGDGKVGDSTEAKQALMMPFVDNRAFLLERLNAALNAMLSLAQTDKTKTAAIGFCFGGLCAIDLARSGANLTGIVSFHGLLNRPEHLPLTPIQSKLLLLHGYDDPMVPPEQVQSFCDEMTKAKADWQFHMYGQTSHAFTNPKANDPVLGTKYQPVAAKRAFQSMQHFLTDILS